MIYDCEGLGLKHLWKPAVETYGEVRGRTGEEGGRGVVAPLLDALWVAEAMGAQAGPEVCAHRQAALSPQFLCMVEDNYPETLKRLFVIKGKRGPPSEEVGGRIGE